MQRRRNVALGSGNQLAFLYLLTDQHNGPCRRANVLLKHQVHTRRQRQFAHRLVGSRTFVVGRMDAPVVPEKALERFHESHDVLTSQAANGLGMTQCCRVIGVGFMSSASVGHFSMQLPQPVHASRSTL